MLCHLFYSPSPMVQKYCKYHYLGGRCQMIWVCDIGKTEDSNYLFIAITYKEFFFFFFWLFVAGERAWDCFPNSESRHKKRKILFFIKMVSSKSHNSKSRKVIGSKGLEERGDICFRFMSWLQHKYENIFLSI